MLLNARRVFDEDGSASAILLAIEDMTRRREAEREKDELLQQKEILLQEMQHRVANSLQIIASILLLKARTVQSEETRHHLRDAHQRVMSVATVQEQLHASGLNERIEIGPYLTKLCASLAASMVGERRPLSIKVQATSGSANSSEAVSLGLIVTELVINALKHGFPSGEKGGILVKYEAQNSGWQLSVADNGSGPKEAAGEPPHMGLGTSIVEALAHQLGPWSTKRVDLRAPRLQLRALSDKPERPCSAAKFPDPREIRGNFGRNVPRRLHEAVEKRGFSERIPCNRNREFFLTNREKYRAEQRIRKVLSEADIATDRVCASF